jgi:hypothetical protein
MGGRLSAAFHRIGIALYSGYTAMAGLERMRAARRRLALGRRRVAAIGRGRSVHKVADENVVDELDVAVQVARRPVPAPPIASAAASCMLHVVACRCVLLQLVC